MNGATNEMDIILDLDIIIYIIFNDWIINRQKLFEIRITVRDLTAFFAGILV